MTQLKSRTSTGGKGEVNPLIKVTLDNISEIVRIQVLSQNQTQIACTSNAKILGNHAANSRAMMPIRIYLVLSTDLIVKELDNKLNTSPL